MDDGELVQAIQRGEQAALALLYDRYVHTVWRYVRAHLVGSPDAADDLVSETFLAAIGALERFDSDRGSVYGWLLGIARHKLHDHWQRVSQARAIDGIEEEELGAEGRLGPDGEMMTAETRAAVLRTLADLDDDDRLALEWKYLDALSVREIAARLGATEKAVESRLSRARAAFRVRYARRPSQLP